MDWFALLLFANALASAITGIVIIARGLGRSYRWLIIYLIGQATLGIGGALLHKYPNVYGTYYFTIGVLIWIASACAAVEGYTKVMANHPGIARLGRQFLWGSLLAAGALSVVTVFLRTNPDFSALLAAGIAAERYVRFGILVFWCSLIVFLIWFPVSLNRNTVIHAFLFAAYFLVATIAVLVSAIVSNEFRLTLAIGRACLMFCCMAGWALLLTPKGETTMWRIGHRWNRSEESKLLAQLDAINAHLVSTSRAQ